MRTPRNPSQRRAVAVVAALAVCFSLALAGLPAAAAQSSGGEGGATTGGAERRCLPEGGHDFTIGDGNPHINLTIHTSLVTDPAPPSAFGMEARGVALGAEIIELRTGVMVAEMPSEASADGVFESLVVIFDYRFSLPMFAGSVDDSTYEPTGGPVSGVDTREC
ncbi:MAG: hypothetical protein ABEK02_08250 [Haloquadratum sp.]